MNYKYLRSRFYGPPVSTTYDDYGFDLPQWVGLFCGLVSWVGLGPLATGLGWVGSQKMDQRSCLVWTGKGLDTCYSATYFSQTCDKQRFIVSEVAADRYEPMVPQRIMWPSITALTDNWTDDLLLLLTMVTLIYLILS